MSYHRHQAPITVLAPVAHALQACLMPAAGHAARCRACLPVRPGLGRTWRIVRVRRRRRRNVLVHGRTHGLSSIAVPAAVTTPGAFPCAAPASAGTRAHVRQDALADLVQDQVTGSVGEGALECSDCRRCSLQAYSQCRGHSVHYKCSISLTPESISAAAQHEHAC